MSVNLWHTNVSEILAQILAHTPMYQKYLHKYLLTHQCIRNACTNTCSYLQLRLYCDYEKLMLMIIVKVTFLVVQKKKVFWWFQEKEKLIDLLNIRSETLQNIFRTPQSCHSNDDQSITNYCPEWLYGDPTIDRLKVYAWAFFICSILLSCNFII